MLSEAVAVVRHVDHEGVLFKIQPTESSEHAADVAVEKSDGGVIGRDDSAFVLIVEITENLGDLPRILRADAGGGGLGRPIEVAVFDGEIEGGVRLLKAG